MFSPRLKKHKWENPKDNLKLEFKNRLDYATKIPYFDQIRECAIAYKLPFFKWLYTFLHAFFKSLMKYAQFLFSSSIKRSVRAVYRDYDWVIANDHTGHCELFMSGIIDRFSRSTNVLYISLNPKLTLSNTDISLQINELKYFTVSSLSHAIVYSWSRRNMFKGFGLWNALIFLNYVFSAARALEASKFYQKIHFKKDAKLITLCDSHWHQSVLTSDFKERGLKTFTLIHGMPSEWHLVYPFLSDYVLTWGNSMSDMTLKYCQDIDRSRIIQIGNTKYVDLGELNYGGVNSFSDIEEIVFLSPGFDSFNYYGLDGLKKEITRFLGLNFPRITFSIRPRPNIIEQRFIEQLICEMGMQDRVKILNDSDFSSIVNNKRIFVGSISSAIADVFILNGFFVGLSECMLQDDLEATITYSSEIYFNMEDLEAFLESLRDKTNFQSYLEKIVQIRSNLVITVPQDLDKHIERKCIR